MQKIEPLKSPPVEWPESLLPAVRPQLQANRHQVEVLANEPGFAQVVYGIL
jgi:hypothetical protein